MINFRFDQNKKTKTAFVFSGGGNLGALEAGALVALFENGIKPDMLVGTSVGALNATAVAINPVLDQAKWLVNLWTQAAKQKIFQADYFSMAKRFLRGKCSLMSNERLFSFIKSHLASSITSFADIKESELYITATDIEDGKLHVFGSDPKDSLLDAMMASTALPFYLPPWEYNGHKYVDGAVLSDVPVKVAVKMGASEIYALDAVRRHSSGKKLAGLYDIAMQVIHCVVKRHLLDEIDWVQQVARVDIHYIQLNDGNVPKKWDLREGKKLLDAGYETTIKYLDEEFDLATNFNFSPSPAFSVKPR